MENLKIFADAVGRISVAVPFSRGFIAAARSISGRWDAPAKVWTFDSHDRERLTEILYKFLGMWSTRVVSWLRCARLWMRAPMRMSRAR